MSKLKRSLLFQTSFLFFISTLIIISLWGVFYIKEIKKIKAQNITRYMRTAEFLQPMLFRLEAITQEHLDAFAMQEYNKALPHDPVFKKGNKNAGVKVYKIGTDHILHIYNPIQPITLKDVAPKQSISSIHTIFSLLLFLQLLLYLRLRSSLAPLSKLHTKFQSLQKGDMSPLELNSRYEETQQIKNSYNKAVNTLDYLLNMREMFNKIFMHELKTPLAKGMFYLKMPYSKDTQQKLTKLFTKINDEIDDFARIESLIMQNGIKESQTFAVANLLNESIDKLQLQKQDHVTIQGCEGVTIIGDKELWILCFKNIIDNAVKYAFDKKLSISCDAAGISFTNIGDPLPIDPTKEVTQWKIDRSKRHQSSTGYGFGLFIISSIVKVQGYTLYYSYDEKNKTLLLQIFQP